MKPETLSHLRYIPTVEFVCLAAALGLIYFVLEHTHPETLKAIGGVILLLALLGGFLLQF